MSQNETHVIPAALFCPSCGHCLIREEEVPGEAPKLPWTWIVTSSANAKVIH
jgi:hypothetical protein